MNHLEVQIQPIILCVYFLQVNGLENVLPLSNPSIPSGVHVSMRYRQAVIETSFLKVCTPNHAPSSMKCLCRHSEFTALVLRLLAAVLLLIATAKMSQHDLTFLSILIGEGLV